MKSIKRIGNRPAALTLAAETLVEFHAARLLLLLKYCGVAGRIDSLTKMAKLDFFARYPTFFEAARFAIESGRAASALGNEEGDDVIESAMVRHHYGPWDKRYYHVLAYLEARGLISVTKAGKAYILRATAEGARVTSDLASRPAFGALILRMREIKRVFGSKTGSVLKQLIYQLFDQEVGRRRMGEVIRR